MLASIVLVLAGVPYGRADDVPDVVRPHYDEAMQRFEAGDLKLAYTAISKGKAKHPKSVDFWELYVRIWRALEKKESVLWDKVVAKAEAKHPGSPVFCLLRFRFAADAEERIAHLKEAIETAPGAVEPRTLLAREYVHRDRGLAAEIIDTVLEEDPANEMALALKGTLDLAAGHAQRALEYAEAKLARHDYPALHDLVARALLAITGEEASRLEKAEAEAREALRARPQEWRFALTLVEVLDRRGQSKEAKDLLVQTHEKTPAPDLAAKLGEFVFRTGDYEEAAKGISLLPYEDVRALKALAVCHVRLGNAEEARDALRRLLAKKNDDDTRRWAALRELELGDAGAARRHLEGLEGEAAERSRLEAAAWAGDPTAAKRLAGEKARGDSRTAEEWLLPIVHALLFEEIGSRADAARKLLIDAAAAAGRANVATATVPAEEPFLIAHTLGFIQRYATYRRCLDGSWFEPLEEIGLSQRDVNDIPTPIATIEAESTCPRDAKRFFPFRPADKLKDRDLQKTMTNWLGGPSRKRWGEALGGFGKGCIALVDGDYATAKAGFGWALEREPGWGRARLFRAVAAALEGTDLRGAAADAELAAKGLIDDWDGRTVAILVRYLAKKSVASELKALAERRESFAPRLYDDL